VQKFFLSAEELAIILLIVASFCFLFNSKKTNDSGNKWEQVWKESGIEGY
jgi:hypothetical protein